MGAIGAGIAVLGAWLFAGRMLSEKHIPGLTGSRGWGIFAVVVAVVGTAGIIDSLA